MLPLAHAGHYAIWVFYALPVVVVVGAIVKGYLTTKRRHPAPTHAPPEVPAGKEASPAGGDDREDSPDRESPRSETGPAGRKP